MKKPKKNHSFGQAALLIHRPSTFSAPDGPPFWAAIPAHPAVYWPVFVLTVSVSVVASQALISASFSIVKQGQCGFMPRLQVIHTSKHHEGQIYMPAVNWVSLLCFGLFFRVAEGFFGREKIHEKRQDKLTSSLFFFKKKKALAILCLSVVVGFRESNAIGEGYGITVLASMLLT